MFTFKFGIKKFKKFVEYNSENTKRLNEKDIIKLLNTIGINNV